MNYPWFGLACVVTAMLPLASPAATVFEIGKADGDYAELAIAGKHGDFPKRFPSDVSFTIGQSRADADWPFIHPGPEDSWAGGRPHRFDVNFTLPAVAAGYYRLVIDFVGSRSVMPPRLTLVINGTELKRRLPAGTGDQALTNPKVRKAFKVEQLFPASLLRPGANVISVLNAEGGWTLYDSLRLEDGAAVPEEIVRAQAQSVPWFKRGDTGPKRVLKLLVDNPSADSLPVEVGWKAGAESGSQSFTARLGENEWLV